MKLFSYVLTKKGQNLTGKKCPFENIDD